MSELRIGQGLDFHRFAEEGDDPARPLVLGGVELAGERPLVGHSDADALAHALTDALFGAAGLGDIGSHFPDNDPAYAGADSLALLAEAARRCAAEGWRLVNADCTVLGERPRVAPHREEMAVHLSAAAGGPVHVKATRPEGLGALGRVEGLACFAIALLER
ncbi:MAG TPA: 2-C-methyl-D-erythritol 2,4-cyclodiphosphate synthase [Acidimicrobiales bacterium]|nr:2-C-methyl-D-erythritol 2,4-cyclodiphosphate synthase [Acidimicrobiales bacterium]